MRRYLKPVTARRLYDRIGRLEDTQAFYEDPALDVLVKQGGFGTADHVFEFGCGTGRLADRLLSRALPDTARYAGCDISATMIGIAGKRLGHYGARVKLWQSDGGLDFAPAAPPFDRIVTTYVLDLMPPERIDAFLDAARQALVPGGRLCAASITRGTQGLPWAISAGWGMVHRLSPALVGGCRPIRLGPRLAADRWTILHHATCAPWGVTSEIVIATPV